MMNILQTFFETVSKLGAVVLLPVVIMLLGLFFRMRIGSAIKSGLLVGIGFQGLVLVLNLLMATINPVIAYYEKLGSGFTTIDVGFAAIGGAAWSIPAVVLCIPLIILLNILLIKIKVVNVINVDVWNFIHFMIPGALAIALFDNIFIGVLVTIGLSVITLFCAKWVAPKWEEYFGLEGTTCTTLAFVALIYPIAVFLNKLIDFIPFIKNLEINMDKIESKLGIFGDPTFIGIFVGAFLGILTQQNIPTILTICMGFAAVMILIPRMVGIMMEGVTPIGNAATTFIKKHVSGSDGKFYIGMDIALGLGDPACITVTAITIPFVIGFAFLIPNMTFFPLGLLAQVCYLTPMIVLASKGNVFRSTLLSIICMYFVCFSANYFAPEATAMMKYAGLDIFATNPNATVTDGGHFGWNPGSILVSLIHRLIEVFS